MGREGVGGFCSDTVYIGLNGRIVIVFIVMIMSLFTSVDFKFSTMNYKSAIT